MNSKAKRIEFLKKNLADKPNDPFFVYALAMEHQDFDPDKCLSLLENLREDHPEYLPLYYPLSNLLAEKGKWQIAKTVFEDGIKLATETAELKTERELRSNFANWEIEYDDN